MLNVGSELRQFDHTFMMAMWSCQSALNVTHSDADCTGDLRCVRRGSRCGSCVAAVCFSCRYLPWVFELIVVRDLNYVSEKRVPLLDYG